MTNILKTQARELADYLHDRNRHSVGIELNIDCLNPVELYEWLNSIAGKIREDTYARTKIVSICYLFDSFDERSSIHLWAKLLDTLYRVPDIVTEFQIAQTFSRENSTRVAALLTENAKDYSDNFCYLFCKTALDKNLLADSKLLVPIIKFRLSSIDPFVHGRFLKILPLLGNNTHSFIEEIITSIGNADEGVCFFAMETLYESNFGRLASNAIDMLVNISRSSHTIFRIMSIQCMKSIDLRDERVLQALKRCLEDQDHKVRYIAANILHSLNIETTKSIGIIEVISREFGDSSLSDLLK